MPSTFTWLDYSEQERRRALDVLSLFKLRDTRDELGLASIRDAFAEQFFPGTSTIQTRARYFLLVPWLCLDLERRRASSAQVTQRLRRMEELLITPLVDSEDVNGVIGKEAGKAVKRMPSSIYWAGLRRWGILSCQGSLAQYHRSLDRFYVALKGHRSALDADGKLAPEPANWHAHIPSSPEGFPVEASLTLDPEEAVYLRERIVSTCPGTLLAYLVDRCEVWQPVDFSWLHEFASEFPASVRSRLEHARLFSEVMHGASRLYNVMLADAQHRKDLLEAHEAAFQEWADEEHAQMPRLAAWDLRDFWNAVGALGARITLSTRAFVTAWTEQVRATRHPKLLLSNTRAQELIRQREGRLKKGRARLSNRRHLELWSGDSGTGQLDFRWAVSQRLTLDIVEALAPSAVDRGVHA